MPKGHYVRKPKVLKETRGIRKDKQANVILFPHPAETDPTKLQHRIMELTADNEMLRKKNGRLEKLVDYLVDEVM